MCYILLSLKTQGLYNTLLIPHNTQPSLVVPVGQAYPRLSTVATLPSLVLQISKLSLFPYDFLCYRITYTTQLRKEQITQLYVEVSGVDLLLSGIVNSF